MMVWNDIDALPVFGRTVVTVGTFDGVHRGHRLLLGRVVARARELGVASVVVTFDPHPREVLGGSGTFFALTTMEQKLAQLAKQGIDNVVVLPFTVSLAQMPQEEFVRDILVKRLGAGHLVVGYDNRFGHNRQGGIDTVLALGAGLGFTVEQVEQVPGVSSTLLRAAVAKGERYELGRD